MTAESNPTHHSRIEHDFVAPQGVIPTEPIVIPPAKPYPQWILDSVGASRSLPKRTPHGGNNIHFPTLEESTQAIHPGLLVSLLVPGDAVYSPSLVISHNETREASGLVHPKNTSLAQELGLEMPKEDAQHPLTITAQEKKRPHDMSSASVSNSPLSVKESTVTAHPLDNTTSPSPKKPAAPLLQARPEKATSAAPVSVVGTEPKLVRRNTHPERLRPKRHPVGRQRKVGALAVAVFPLALIAGYTDYSRSGNTGISQYISENAALFNNHNHTPKRTNQEIQAQLDHIAQANAYYNNELYQPGSYYAALSKAAHENNVTFANPRGYLEAISAANSIQGILKLLKQYYAQYGVTVSEGLEVAAADYAANLSIGVVDSGTFDQNTHMDLAALKRSAAETIRGISVFPLELFRGSDRPVRTVQLYSKLIQYGPDAAGDLTRHDALGLYDARTHYISVNLSYPTGDIGWGIAEHIRTAIMDGFEYSYLSHNWDDFSKDPEFQNSFPSVKNPSRERSELIAAGFAPKAAIQYANVWKSTPEGEQQRKLALILARLETKVPGTGSYLSAAMKLTSLSRISL